jgi:hypothetical protein
MKIQMTQAGSTIYNSEAKETTYTKVSIQVKNTQYIIVIAKGKHNYYNIKQVNHCRGYGKDFATLDLAINSYKSIQMKAALMQLSGI